MAADRKELLELNPAVGFILRSALWIVLLFGVLRLDWVQENLLIPFAGLQQQVACGVAGTPKDSVRVDQSCTGSDAMALCVGAILAFPATWRRRLIGCGLGLVLISAVNTVRIGSLSMVVGNRELFRLLHLYLWPALIIVVAAGYVFFWMASARRESPEEDQAKPAVLTPSPTGKRFLVLMIVLVGLYYFAYGSLLDSAALMTVARWAASTAGLIMSAVGVEAQVAGNYLRTAHGAWVVTPECVATPLIPVYLAAVFAAPFSPLRRALAALAAGPLFVLLGTARLLVLALPLALVRSHNVAVHAFYQFLVALILIGLLAYRDRRSSERSPTSLLSRTGLALLAGGGVGLLVGVADGMWLRPALAELPLGIHLGHGYADPQGALAILPAFQLGLFAALWKASGRETAWRPLSFAALILVASQAVAIVSIGELAIHSEIAVPVVLIRAFSLAVPAFLVWIVAGADRFRSVGASAVPVPPSG